MTKLEAARAAYGAACLAQDKAHNVFLAAADRRAEAFKVYDAALRADDAARKAKEVKE